jgi:predicted NACHT family NTPase
MAIIARHESLARSRVGLYEQALNALCWGIEFKRTGMQVAHDSPLRGLGPLDRLELVRHIAWTMQESTGLRANAIVEPQLIDAIRNFFASFGFTKPEQSQGAQEVVDVLQERNWILTLRGPSLYGFVHRTFLEYLCAEHLLRRFRADRPELLNFFREQILPHIDDDSWLEVIRLLAGLLGRDDPEIAGEIISFLAPDKLDGEESVRRVTLAFECLAEQEKCFAIDTCS